MQLALGEIGNAGGRRSEVGEGLEELERNEEGKLGDELDVHLCE